MKFLFPLSQHGVKIIIRSYSQLLSKKVNVTSHINLLTPAQC